MISYAKTDTGLVRRSNQDFLFAADQPVGPLPNLFIVADGMGGHKAGDFASRYVVEHMKEYIENSDLASPVMILRKALEKTNQGLFEEAQGNPDREGMGSTLVAATIEDDMMYVANVGDSRLYKIIQVDEKVPFNLLIPLSIQHMFAMFGASVLVPFLFGINPAIVLFMNGVGTLMFIFITKGKAPAYLGSSFAFLVLCILDHVVAEHGELHKAAIADRF